MSKTHALLQEKKTLLKHLNIWKLRKSLDGTTFKRK
jgi:hypothetical protein